MVNLFSTESFDFLFISQYKFLGLSSSCCLLAFMWIFQVSFWSKSTPRCFASVLMGIWTLLMFTWGQRALRVHQETTLYANQYKLHTTGHSYQLISELFHVSYNVRRHQRIWPDDLAGWFQRTIDGRYLTQDIHLTYYLPITLQKPE
jgi:hypothetical protein